MGDAAASVSSTANVTNAVNAASASASAATAAATGVASTVTGAVTNVADSLAASITNMLDSVFADIDQAIARTKNWNDDTHNHHHHSNGGGSGDRYVTGDTNWDTYDLPTLVSMVAEPASPSQVQEVAGLWRSNGAAITQGAETLNQSLTTLMNYWQGAASQQVSASVSDTGGWITAVGETAGKVADQVEDASGALQSAQNTMPGVPTSNFWVAYNTAADGSTTGAPAGPFGAAAGTMVGGLSSVFQASNDNGSMKQQAVQTMQRFEQAGVNIDTTTPQFAPPPAWGSARTTATGSGGRPAAMMTAPGPQSQTTTGVNLTTTPSFALDPTGRWDGLTGGPGGSGGLGDPSGAQAGSFAGGFVGFGGGGGGFGKDSETQRASVPTIQPGNAAAGAGAAPGADNPAGIVGRTTDSAAMGSSVMEEVDARAAAGGGAMPMGGGMMGAGARGAGGSEEEYRRRIPFEEDPFITGLKAVPPVIGLSALDREADR